MQTTTTTTTSMKYFHHYHHQKDARQRQSSMIQVVLIVLISVLSQSSNVCAQNAVDGQYCDEAKCRGSRIHPWVDDDTEFTCWVSMDVNITQDGILDDTYYTAYEGHYCADGYEGRIVESVTPQEIDGELRQWFTCCTPGYTGEIQQSCDDWTCSSPDWEGGGNCWADGFQEPMTCGTTERRYPRFTGMKSLIYVQFLCCDSPQVDDSFMQELFLARIIWMTLSGITFIICTMFITGILISSRARAQGYNLYLVFLAAPDAVANLLILMRCGLTIPGVPVHPNIHIVLASFEYFYAAANMWLNGVIVAQIHYVLRRSKNFEKVPPPTPRLVCYQAGCTYAFSLLVFGWAFFLYHEGLNVFSLAKVVVVWISTRVVMVAPPLFYVTYVCFDVWYNKLLPRSGRTRVVSLYFLRVIIVFLLTWVPYFIVYEIAWNITHSRWMVHGSYYLGSVQGTLSVLVALSKPDVKRAFFRFLCCQCNEQVAEESSFWLRTRTTSKHRGSSSFFPKFGLGGVGSDVDAQDQDCTGGRIRVTGSVQDNNERRSTAFNFMTAQQIIGPGNSSLWEMEDEWSTNGDEAAVAEAGQEINNEKEKIDLEEIEGSEITIQHTQLEERNNNDINEGYKNVLVLSFDENEMDTTKDDNNNDDDNCGDKTRTEPTAALSFEPGGSFYEGEDDDDDDCNWSREF